MAKNLFLLAAGIGAVLALPVQAQPIRPDPVVDIAAMSKEVRTICARKLGGTACGDAQRRLVLAVRDQNASRSDREIGNRQVDALVNSLL